MSLHMVCSCGNGLIVPEEHVGRQVKCPRCGKSVAVPRGVPGVAVSPQAAPKRGRPVLFVLLGLLLLLSIGAAVFGLWRYSQLGSGPSGDGPEVGDLALLPADAQMVATIRMAELYKMPAARDAFEQVRQRDPNKEDPAARMERETGLKPDEIERLHIVGFDVDKQSGWVVARTLAPIDRNKVLDKLAGRIDLRHVERRYYVGKTGAGADVAIHFAGPNVLVLANEEGMKKAMEQAAKPVTEGPLKPIIGLVETSKSQAIVGLNAQAGGLDPIKKNLPIKFESFDKIKVLRLTLDADDKEAALSATAEMPDEKAAKALRTSLGVILGTVQLLYLPAIRNRGGDEAKIAAILDKLISAMKFTVKGNEVQATAKTEPAAIMVVVMYLAGQAMPKK
jgi:hypothetical protein